MNSDEGLRIISVTKSLEGFQRGDRNISRYFGSTMLAGHAGLFLSSLRKHRKMKLRKFRALAASAHIDAPLLKSVVIPWLEDGGFIEVRREETGGGVLCNVVDHDAILGATSKLLRALEPTEEERVVLGIVELGIRMPQLKSDVLNHFGLGKDETVERALSLAEEYKIVRVGDGGGGKGRGSEPIVYSPLIWGDNIGKAGRALSHLSANKRAILLELIDRVRQYQGLPYEQAKEWAEGEGEPDIIEFAARIGLVDRTVITVAEGEQNSFITTPHLYGELAATQGKDVCDRIRLFLDSIRHGQHYGKWYTGRIVDPAALLGKLVDKGQIGPCTAIGQDYQLVERAGIVNVKPSTIRKGQFVMKVVQEDTIELVRDIVSQTNWGGGSTSIRTHACGQNNFISSEETRAKLGVPPRRVLEAEHEMLRNLREM